MDYTFFMLPLSIMEKAERGSDENGNFLKFNNIKVYRLHLVGTVAALEVNEESGSGYLILDDTFSTILVHFQKQFFNQLSNIERGDIVEVLGTIDVYNESTTLSLNNIRRVDLERYSYNKIESIKNAKELSR
jgi:RPA family protein